MVFKRYHSPLEYLDILIQNKAFEEGVVEIARESNNDKLWEIYLVSGVNMSFDTWKRKVTANTETRAMTKAEVDTALYNSQSILANFNPEGVTH
ncbi:hypothetical protein LJC20_00510 [Eubacteriales bacterium OttesenSCG-928-M02]|nr:hypothetical protein [Eubacteriales bacterium OttesenSCG-928-M02]